MKRLLLATSALASCLFSLPAQAQSIWGGAGSSTTTNDYNLGTNWSNGVPPTAVGQAAQFGDGGAGPASTAVSTGAAAIAPDSWTFTATSQSYTISGSTVNFNGAGPNLVNNANAGQAISISNNMTGAGISQAGASTLTLSGTNAFTTTSITAGTLVNSGSLTSTITNSATFTNNNNVVGDVTSSGNFGNNGTVTGSLSQSAGISYNYGTITSTLGLTGGSFTNYAGGQVQGATTNNGGTVDNNATMAGVTNTSGTFNNNSSGSITTLNNNGGTFANASGATVSGAATISGGTVTNAGTFSSTLGLTGGTFTNNSGGQVQGATTNNGGTVNNNATMAGVTNTSGTFNNKNGGSITTLNNNGGGAFTNYIGATVTGAATLSSGWINNAGTLASTLSLTGGTFENTGVGQVQGATTNNGGLMVNYAVMAGVTNTSGTFNNNTGSSITTLNNNGGSFGNQGTVSGAATISAGSVTNSVFGTFSSTLSVTGGTFTNTSGGHVQGATTNNGGTVNNTATMAGVTNTAGIFNNNSGGSITTLTITGGNFTNASGATVSGAATMSTATVVNSGTFESTLSVGVGNFQNQASGQVQGAATINGGGITNLGAMADVTIISGNFNNTTGTAGAVSNADTGSNGGTIASLSNSGGNFSNFGAISGAMTISGGVVFVTAGGTIGGAVSLTNAAATLNISGVTAGLSVASLSGVSGSAVNLGAKTLTISGGTQVFGGVIQGSGNLIISSGVSEGLTGSSSYTGTTTINGGLLKVDGSIASSSMTTLNSGSLLGVGTVGNLTVNGGVFTPGGGVVGGSMTVAGSLVLAAASTYLVEVTPATSTSGIVTGNANLGGATLGANFAAGSYVAKTYTILTAGSITGTFNSTVSTLGLPAGFSTSVSYDAANTHAYLNLVLNFAPPSGSLNVNQQNVGNAIVNFFNATGGIPMAFGGLTPSGLTQLSGEVGSAPQQSTFNAMTQFMGVMTDPFVAGRGDPVSAVGAPNAYAEESMAYAATVKGRSASARDALAAYTKAPVAPAFEQRWSVWAAGFGGSQQTDGNNALGSNNTTSSLYGTAVGADYRVSRDTLLGFALAGGGTNFSVANNLGGGRSDLFQAGAFFRHNAGPAYITGALAYGWQDIVTDRTVTVAGVDRMRAEFNANAWSGRLEGGYRFVSQGIGLTPYAAAQVTAFDLPAYAEQAISGSNQFALAYGAKSVTDTRSELGLRTDKAFAQSDGIVTLRGRVAWAHDFNSNRTIGATFQTLPGASFVVNGAAMASETALVTASAEKRWLNGWAAAATFEGEFSNVTRSYAGKGVVRYAW
ncbi:autotransporter domain-containing protein [Bradyrhizobium cajani]|uniref:Autotransporter domain-containing protein n=1 Tax=Bradyrhizobium cajani TaxID=1928661 RepID=A0A844TSU4_9BRAD|nr:autotransporter domain-containing protein [Bradyrhizobium cajani]MCP3374142.1 autotransporter domain-containing protein [Bradyrhizobium cajani]MVT78272.1 autotransporter domain-containing protein [Bradyrhizobium cajani]